MSQTLSIIVFILIMFSPVFYKIYQLIRSGEVDFRIIFSRIKKYLIYATFISAVVIAFILSLNYINFLDYKEPMPFSKYDSITFHDFKAYEFFRKSFEGERRFAYIVTSIEVKINDDNIEVQSLFHPSRSFVYNSKINSKELLTHELYHFKITELYARHIRKKLKELNSLDKNIIDSIVEQEKIKGKIFQKKYDFDTYHSYVYQQQKLYEKQIDSLLSLYSEYKQPIININESK